MRVCGTTVVPQVHGVHAHVCGATVAHQVQLTKALTATAFMSWSCPVNVCWHCPTRISHSWKREGGRLFTSPFSHPRHPHHTPHSTPITLLTLPALHHTPHSHLTPTALHTCHLPATPLPTLHHTPTPPTLAVASQAPDTKRLLLSGAREMLITSPVWPRKVDSNWPVSMFHSALEGGGEEGEHFEAFSSLPRHCEPLCSTLVPPTVC